MTYSLDMSPRADGQPSDLIARCAIGGFCDLPRPCAPGMCQLKVGLAPESELAEDNMVWLEDGEFDIGNIVARNVCELVLATSSPEL